MSAELIFLKRFAACQTESELTTTMMHARVWLSGFLLLGILLGLLGPLIVVWQYHLDAEPQIIGLHFLAVNAGYLGAAAIVGRTVALINAHRAAATGLLLSCSSLVALTFVAPPVNIGWRLLTLAAMGAAAGIVAGALFYAPPQLAARRAAYQASLLFGCGSLLAATAIAGMYFSGHADTGPALLAALALIVFLALAPPRTRQHESDTGSSKTHKAQTPSDIRSVAIVLFGSLLFFQAGNEWAIAGWLPIYLVHRLGSNPALAIAVLGIFFLALTLGRMGTYYLLPRVSRRYFLLASVASAIAGLFLLSFSHSLGEATWSVTVVGAAFAPIYPILSERLDERFSGVDPGFYNLSASLAITGGMCTQWLLGFVAGGFGMRYLLLFPALVSVIVLLLALLFLFEAHLMRQS